MMMRRREQYAATDIHATSVPVVGAGENGHLERRARRPRIDAV
jgi:hypothetical protein